MITYTRIITDEEQKILENDILDVKEWIDLAIQGKINSCLKRLATSYREKLIKDGAVTVPAKMEDLATAAFQDPKYKNRTERDLEEKQKEVKIK